MSGPEPNGLMPEMNQFDEMTRAYRNAMPKEVASAMNLMAHPMAGFAAAGAIGLGMAGHAMGVWMGAVAGMAEASQRMLADVAEAPARRPAAKPALLKLVASTPAPETGAAEARRTTRSRPQPAAAKASAEKAAPALKAKSLRVDDLKAISGIGPKLEKVLNGLGIVSYEQVAKLTKAEIVKLDDQLGFAGRIERDDWRGQARSLMAGA